MRNISQQGVYFSAALSDVTRRHPSYYFPVPRALEGESVALDRVRDRVAGYYQTHKVESPGVLPGDIAQALCAE